MATVLDIIFVQCYQNKIENTIRMAKYFYEKI